MYNMYTAYIYIYLEQLVMFNPLGAVIEKRNLTACATLVINCV